MIGWLNVTFLWDRSFSDFLFYELAIFRCFFVGIFNHHCCYLWKNFQFFFLFKFPCIPLLPHVLFRLPKWWEWRRKANFACLQWSCCYRDLPSRPRGDRTTTTTTTTSSLFGPCVLLLFFFDYFVVFAVDSISLASARFRFIFRRRVWENASFQWFLLAKVKTGMWCNTAITNVALSGSAYFVEFSQANPNKRQNDGKKLGVTPTNNIISCIMDIVSIAIAGKCCTRWDSGYKGGTFISSFTSMVLHRKAFKVFPLSSFIERPLSSFIGRPLRSSIGRPLRFL